MCGIPIWVRLQAVPQLGRAVDWKGLGTGLLSLVVGRLGSEMPRDNV